MGETVKSQEFLVELEQAAKLHRHGKPLTESQLLLDALRRSKSRGKMYFEWRVFARFPATHLISKVDFNHSDLATTVMTLGQAESLCRRMRESLPMMEVTVELDLQIAKKLSRQNRDSATA